MTAPAVLPGAEAWSHHALDPTDGPAPGALVLHGFTGNPSSMRGLAETLAAEGLHVELPRLPGHGTTIDDMLTTGWADWTAEVEAAYQRLAARAEQGRRGRAQHGRLAGPVDRASSTPRSPGSCSSTRPPSRSRPRS